MYVVLPIGMKGSSLSVLQNNLNKVFENKGITGSANIYRLNDSKDGKEVYEIKSEDNSLVNKGSIKTYDMRFDVIAPEYSSGITATMMNANNKNEMPNDVLFLGSKDGHDGFAGDATSYPTVDARLVGINSSDDSVVRGIMLDGTQRKFDYFRANITDTYRIFDKNNGTILNTITKTGLSEDTYSRKGFVDNLKSLGLDKDKFDEKSLSINDGSLTDTVKLNSVEGFNNSENQKGHTYDINVEEIGKPVTVLYHDENGNNIEKPTVMKGNVESIYQAKQKDFNDYVFHDVKGEVTGKFSQSPKTIIFTYYKKNSLDHTVNFYNMSGKKIANEITIKGSYKDHYDLTQQVNDEIKVLNKLGYNFVSSYGSIQGNFEHIHEGADFILTKFADDQIGSVQIKYTDTLGNNISESKIISGKLGSAFKTEKKEITGYVLQEVKGKESGNYTVDGQTVTYLYKAVNAENQTKPVSDGKLTVKYVDEKGKNLLKPVITTKKAGTVYKTERKHIDGYDFKDVKGSETGKYTADDKIIIYTYTKKNTLKPVQPDNPVIPSKPNDKGSVSDSDNKYDSIGKDNNENIKNAFDSVNSVLPKTSANKIKFEFVGVITFVISFISALLIWKKRN